MNEPRVERDLYERDFSDWALEQARLLREGRNRHAGRNRLRVTVVHLLKERYQPDKRSGSWRGTILEQQRRLKQLLVDSPSLRRFIESDIREDYPTARQIAAAQTGLPITAFPVDCPFPRAEVLGSED